MYAGEGTNVKVMNQSDDLLHFTLCMIFSEYALQEYVQKKSEQTLCSCLCVQAYLTAMHY